MPKTPVTRVPINVRLDKRALAYLKLHNIRYTSVINSLVCDFVRQCQRDDLFMADVDSFGHRAHYKMIMTHVV